MRTYTCILILVFSNLVRRIYILIVGGILLPYDKYFIVVFELWVDLLQDYFLLKIP